MSNILSPTRLDRKTWMSSRRRAQYRLTSSSSSSSICSSSRENKGASYFFMFTKDREKHTISRFRFMSTCSNCRTRKIVSITPSVVRLTVGLFFLRLLSRAPTDIRLFGSSSPYDSAVTERARYVASAKPSIKMAHAITIRRLHLRPPMFSYQKVKRVIPVGENTSFVLARCQADASRWI